MPPGPLDILAQQIVAACVPEDWDEESLHAMFRRAWPYRDLSREEFDAVVALHTAGRRALLHRDGVNGRLLATKRARLTALLSGGAIPDTADYQVRLEPEGTLVGTVNEDFAVESNGGDIFQLGNASWRILRIEPGIVRVADAKGQPPSIPFWLGEAPGRTRELAAEIGELREASAGAGTSALETLRRICGDALPEGGAMQIAEYVAEGARVLGGVPTQRRVVLERFFDESGGMQLVVHAPFGSKINRAWGLALRKRFCVGFGFELQAAANEEAIVLSLGPQHSFALEEVFDYLHPRRRATSSSRRCSRRRCSRRAGAGTRSARCCSSDRAAGRRSRRRSCGCARTTCSSTAFPEVLACPETLPGGPIEVPMDHPIVRQTIEDCLTEAMDVDGFLEVLRGLRDGSIERSPVDTVEPSAFARGILNSQPYTFLDDAPLEERRTQAVLSRRVLDRRTADELGALDPDAIARVREEAWPQPENAEEVHEALLWMGYVTEEEARPWQPWLDELAAGRPRRARRRPLVRGRGAARPEDGAARPPRSARPGLCATTRCCSSSRPRASCCARGSTGSRRWCDRRLLARIHRYTLDRLRREIEPVTAAQFLRFLACWQHADPEHRLEGPRGVAEVARPARGLRGPRGGLGGERAPGARARLPARVARSADALRRGRLGAALGRRREPDPPHADLPRAARGPRRLDGARRRGAGARAFGDGRRGLRGAVTGAARCSSRSSRGPRSCRPSFLEAGLAELIALGLVTCDSFAGLRWLIVPASKRRSGGFPGGPLEPSAARSVRAGVGRVHRAAAARRTGVVFRKTLAREKQPVPWRDIARVLRTLEARGEVRGGRFVAGFDGEQYALPEAVTLLRAVRRGSADAAAAGVPLLVSAADPLNFRGILTPDERIAPTTRKQVLVA